MFVDSLFPHIIRFPFKAKVTRLVVLFLKDMALSEDISREMIKRIPPEGKRLVVLAPFP